MRKFRWRVALALVTLIHCGGEQAQGGGCPPGEELGVDGRCRPVSESCPVGTFEDCEPPRCPAGQWWTDGACVPAGLNPDRCEPGTLETPEGCRPAGVAPEDCPAGFVAEDAGCTPILPAEPCPEGLMALPGETTCREVAPCGTGTWGDIPTDSTTEHVDRTFTGVSNGNAAAPWKTIQEGVDAAAPEATVAVAAGSYPAFVTIAGKPVTLWGRCPALVTVGHTLRIEAGADGTVLRGLRTGRLLYVEDAASVLIDRCWLNTEGSALGAIIKRELAPTSAVVRDCLVENVSSGGIAVASGAQVDVETSTVRDVPLHSNQETGGVGIQYQLSSGSVRGSLFERLDRRGISIDRSVVEVENTVIRAVGNDLVLSDALTCELGSEVTLRGVHVSDSDGVGVLCGDSELSVTNTTIRDLHVATISGEPGVGLWFIDTVGAGVGVTVRTSIIERVFDVGLALNPAGEVIVEGVVIREVASSTSGGSGGVLIQPWVDFAFPQVTIRGSRIEQLASVGILLEGGTHVTEDVLVADIDANEHNLGLGIAAAKIGPVPEVFALTATNVQIERVRGVGLLARDAELSVSRSRVADISITPDDFYGRAMSIEAFEGGTPQTEILGVLVERTREVAIHVNDRYALIDGCLVRDTEPRGAGTYGDGITVHSGAYTASADIRNTRIEQSARAAVANFGAAVRTEALALSCQAFDLVVESSETATASFDNAGANACGCPDTTQDCHIVSPNIEPPAPVSGM